MEEYETAEKAATYFWVHLVGKDPDRREEVMRNLKYLLNRKLEQEGQYRLFSPREGQGRLDYVTKTFAQEALADGVRPFDLRITKENIIDLYVNSNEPIFEVSTTKTQ